MTALLEIRKKLKSKKPAFTRQDAHKKVKLGNKWRKPRGSDSKMRYQFKGYKRSVKKGWKSPKNVRSLAPNGLMPVLISSIDQLKKINKEKQGIIISKSIGNKKRIGLIKKSQESNIAILNIKEPAEYLRKIQEDFENRKQEKKRKAEEKTKRKKETERKAEEKTKKEAKKEELTEKITEEEKKKQEKKEKDKLLIKKE